MSSNDPISSQLVYNAYSMSPARRVKVIFNPYADGGRAWAIASSLQATIEKHGGADWTATEHPTHATDLAEAAAKEGYEVVAALGGDGTVHEVVNGLMRNPADERPKLAIIPLGSGNDFCANVGVLKPPEDAMRQAFSGGTKSVDVALVRDETGREEYWDNVLGIGFDAATVINSLSITRLRGFAMYFLAVMRTIFNDHVAPRMRIEIDDQVIEDELLLLALCNGAREGGGFMIAPDATPDDGVLDFTMVEYVSRLMMLRLVPEFMNGTHGRFKQVRMGKFRRLHLVADQPLVIHTDGEIFATVSSEVRELTVEVLPQALHVIA
jgi:YegS/Rv2252/BmrU family lipid kinase